MWAISGMSPINGEIVDGETLKKEYEEIKEELMQVLRKHKLTACQACYALGMCRESIDIAMNGNDAQCFYKERREGMWKLESLLTVSTREGTIQ